MIEDLLIYVSRLSEDLKDMRCLEERCPYISFTTPRPELIVVEYTVPGLHKLPDESVVVASRHTAEFFRPPTYPVTSGPIVRMSTPGVRHYHANIDSDTGMVCYGLLEPEKWAPSIGFDEIVLIVARMLRLETYNLNDVIRSSADAAHYTMSLAAKGKLPLSKEPLISAAPAPEVSA